MIGLVVESLSELLTLLHASVVGASPGLLVVVALLGIVVVVLVVKFLSTIARLAVQGLLVGVAVLALAGAVGYASGQPLPLNGKAALALAQHGGVAVVRAATGGLPHARLDAVERGLDGDVLVDMPPLLPDRAAVAAPSVAWVVVAQTGGDGVYLRATPRMADHLRAWGEGTKLEVIGEDASGDGHHWKRVRDPSGEAGWVPAEFVLPLPNR